MDTATNAVNTIDTNTKHEQTKIPMTYLLVWRVHVTQSIVWVLCARIRRCCGCIFAISLKCPAKYAQNTN